MKRPTTPGKILEGLCGGWRGCWGNLKLKALHGGLLLGEEELLVGLVHLGGEVAVLVFHPEVVLDQVEGLLVDLLVVVALEELYLVKAWDIKKEVLPKKRIVFSNKKTDSKTKYK